MLHPVTRAFLQGLRPWLIVLLCLRLVALFDGSPVLWSLHQLVAGLALAANWSKLLGCSQTSLLRHPKHWQ